MADRWCLLHNQKTVSAGLIGLGATGHHAGGGGSSEPGWRVLFAPLCFLHVEDLTAVHDVHLTQGEMGSRGDSCSGGHGSDPSSGMGGPFIDRIRASANQREASLSTGTGPGAGPALLWAVQACPGALFREKAGRPPFPAWSPAPASADTTLPCPQHSFFLFIHSVEIYEAPGTGVHHRTRGVGQDGAAEATRPRPCSLRVLHDPPTWVSAPATLCLASFITSCRLRPQTSFRKAVSPPRQHGGVPFADTYIFLPLFSTEVSTV